jgi:hypothetical protein
MVSRVLGFSTHLDFLVIINEAAVKAGAVLAAAGLLMSGFGRGKRASREVGAAPENISTDNAETVNVPRSE